MKTITEKYSTEPTDFTALTNRIDVLLDLLKNVSNIRIGLANVNINDTTLDSCVNKLAKMLDALI